MPYRGMGVRREEERGGQGATEGGDSRGRGLGPRVHERHRLLLQRHVVVQVEVGEEADHNCTPHLHVPVGIHSSGEATPFSHPAHN